MFFSLGCDESGVGSEPQRVQAFQARCPEEVNIFVDCCTLSDKVSEGRSHSGEHHKILEAVFRHPKCEKLLRKVLRIRAGTHEP